MLFSCDVGEYMKTFVLIVSLMTISSAYAELASVSYVHNTVDTRVDTSAQAKQTMAGEYTVSGTLYVPTPPLPPAD